MSSEGAIILLIGLLVEILGALLLGAPVLATKIEELSDFEIDPSLDMALHAPKKEAVLAFYSMIGNVLLFLGFTAQFARYKATHSKMTAVRDAKSIGSKSSILLAGILICGECGSQMLQITGRKGGFYGCSMNHRKDKTRCSNNRLLNRKKAEGKVTELLKSLFLQPQYLETATKRANEIIKRRLRAAPEEIKALELKKRDAEREIQNLIKFVSVHGDSSATIKESLTTRERELLFFTERLASLRAASVDKMLLTPFALKDKFERLAEYFEKDPDLSNAYVRQLLPQGLRCSPAQKTLKRNHNQNNSFWSVSGTMRVDEFLGLPRLTQVVVDSPSGDTPLQAQI